MTISSEDWKNQYDGTGSQTSFSVTFQYADRDDVVVIHTDADGNDTTWVRGTQYTLTGPGVNGTLTVVTSPTDFTPASDERLTIYRDVGLTQNHYDKDHGTALSGPEIETSFDHLTFIAHRMQEQINRGVLRKQNTETSGPLDLPEPEAEAFLAWDGTGSAVTNKQVVDVGEASFPASSTDNAIAAFDGTSGTSLKDSGLATVDAARAVDNLSDLKALAGGVSNGVVMQGYSSAGDGGGGTFRWDGSDLSTEVAADTQNGVYVPPGGDPTGASGAWVRVDTAIANVRWYGAHASNTDNLTEIQAAIDSLPNGGYLLIPQGTYEVSGEVSCPDHVHLVGEGAAYENNGAVLFGSWLKLQDSAGLTSDQAVIRFEYDNAEDDHRHMGGASRLGVHGNKANNANGNGYLVEGARYVALDLCAAVRCADDGIRVISDTGDSTTSNDTYLHRNNCVFNDGNGINLSGGDSSAIDNICGQNGLAGISTTGSSLTLTGNHCWFNVDGIRLLSAASECSTVANLAYDNNRAGILVSGGSSNHSVTGNSCWDNGQDRDAVGYGGAQKAGIFVSAASTGLTITGNLCGDTGANSPDTQQYGISLNDSGINCLLAGNYGSGNAIDFLNIIAGATVRLHEDISPANATHPGFTAESDIDINSNRVLNARVFSGDVWQTLSSLNSGAVECDRIMVGLNISGGGTVTDITFSGATGLPIVIIRNLNSTSLTIQNSSSALRLQGGTDITLAQHEAMMFVFVSGAVWQHVGA